MARRTTTMKLATLFALGAASALAYWKLRGGGREDADIVYPPTDVPKPVCPDLWIVDSGPISAMGIKLPVRMTIIRLSNGDLVLHSPTRFTAELAQAIERLGRIGHLVAPNSAHWTFLAEWQRAFPDATSWAVPGLRDRPQVRRSGVRIDAELGDAAPSPWSQEIAQGVLPGGAGFRETYLFHKPSRTLIVVDLVQNLEPEKLPSASAVLMRASAATRATTAFHVRAVVKLGGERARRAAAAMIALEPERVIFAHGRFFEKDGARRLRDALAWLIAPSPASR